MPETRRRPARGLYVLLGLLGLFVVCYQVRLLIDLHADFTFQYTSPPFTVWGPPWPSVIGTPDPNAQQAGIRNGDLVVSVDGTPIAGRSDYIRRVHLKHPGDTLAVVVNRNGSELSFAVPLTSVRTKRIRLFVYTFAFVMFVLMPLTAWSLGFTVAAIRIRDPMAWLLLGMLGAMTFLFSGNVTPLAWSAWIRIPSLMFQAASDGWAACLLLFAIYFGGRSTIDVRRPWLKWIVLTPLLFACLVSAIFWIGASERFTAVQWLLAPFGIGRNAGAVAEAVAIVLTIVVFAVKMRAKDIGADTRRRFRLLLWGTVVALTPLAAVLIDVVIEGFQDNALTVSAIMMMLVLPVTMAYVIVVERAMELRVVIRQGVQYALARDGARMLRIILYVAVVSVAIWLANQPAMSAMTKAVAIAGAFTLVLAVGAGAARLGTWIDRKFFREAYETDVILSELADEVHTIVETNSLLRTVAERLSSILHVPNVAVALAGPAVYTPAYATASGVPGLTFAADGETVARLARESKPLHVRFDQENAWVYDERVADDERAALRALEAELLLPLPAKDRLLGFIALGRKITEEPYSATDVRLLRSVAMQTGLALENSRLTTTVAQEIAKRRLVDREVEIAREVQQRLFPQHHPAVIGLDYAGACVPARGVGGDYYDFLALPDGRFGIAIGDVSGKGIPAALMMASLQASLRGQTIRSVDSLAELIASVNRLIYEASPSNRYATFFYGEYTPATRALRYVNAGHNPPIVIRGAETIRLETGGPVVGLFDAAIYREGAFTLKTDDVLILFTDGISESMNAADEEWGEERLVDAARPRCGGPAKEMLDCLMDAAVAFANGAPQHDDMTIVAIRLI